MEVCYENIYPLVTYNWKLATKKKENGRPDFGAVDNPVHWCHYTFRSMLGGKGGGVKYLDHQIPNGNTNFPVTYGVKMTFNG